jgi:hypothetical protein
VINKHFVVRYWLQLLWRERSWICILAILIGGVLLSGFLARTMVLEIKNAQISFTAFYLRSVSLLFFLFMMPFYFIRLHQSQEIIHLLTQFCSRAQFLIQTFIAFALYLSALCMFNLLLLLALGAPIAPTFWWALSLFLECSLLLSICLFLSTRLMLASITSLVGLVIYCLGRMHSLMMASVVQSDALTKLTFKLIPSFDLFTQTNWLIGSTASSAFPSIIIETILFLVLCLTLAILTYQRRWL